MTKDDVLFGYRLQLFAEAARTSVSAACRTFGVHRSDSTGRVLRLGWLPSLCERDGGAIMINPCPSADVAAARWCLVFTVLRWRTL